MILEQDGHGEVGIGMGEEQDGHGLLGADDEWRAVDVLEQTPRYTEVGGRSLEDEATARGSCSVVL